MRKWSLILVLIVGLVGLYGVAQAKVSGPCANCHTMHYSQSPWPSEWPSSSPSGVSGPYKALTTSDCVGCHSGSSATKAGGTIPVVNMTTKPTGTGPEKSLAGGNFYWVATNGGNDSTKGHNVKYLAAVDSNLNYDPPGWDPNATSGFTFGQVAGGAANWGSNQLTCAGTYGCHGDHSQADDFAAIYGSHHTDDSVLKAATLDETAQGTSVGTSYRFLAGIHGIEDSDWEYSATDGTTDHNEYKGASSNQDYADKTTISYLCAECHGYFHSEIGGTSHPWLRHPTDIVLPAAGEYQYYNGNTTGGGSASDYSIVAPVGMATLSSRSTATPGTSDAIVLCISCHRAHGSEYPDLLRWDYSTMEAGGGAGNVGCFICHTQKD
ncbi:MAG: hypothetical protein LWW94_00580 [Candidatus Desulfofervidaceae bacterium]|nr:hypothetical protein [Candidatus Desulfofervidaceae bacterium]